jgi:predicted dehydrogenase
VEYQILIHMPTNRRNFLLGATATALSAQTKKKLRLAIVGAGHRSWAHIEVLKAIPDFEIVAMADPTAENIDHAASLVGGKPALYSDYNKLLAEQKDLDGVIVITPNFLHAEVTVAALNHGVNVLSEKPMATSVDDANRMIAAAAKNGKILQIGQQNRYNPLYVKMVQLVRDGRIGDVEFVNGNIYRGDWYAKSWRYTDPKTNVTTNWRYLTHTAGSSLMEDGIHEIDVLHWMINAKVARVYASGGNNVLKQRETIDHAGIVIDYENGVKFTFNFCLYGQAAGPVARLMVLAGTTGILETTTERNKVSIWKQGAKPELIDAAGSAPSAITARESGPDQDTGTYRQYLAFANSIRTGEKPLVSGEVGKEAIKISLLAEKSLRERRIVTWNDLPA